jgi:hypothetical protein
MTDTHDLRECVQLLRGAIDECEYAEVVEDPALGPIVEATIPGDTIRPSVLSTLATFGLAIDPARSDTRGDPTHTVVVAR